MPMIYIDDDIFYNMLMECIRYYTDNKTTIELFSKYYKECINDGEFERLIVRDIKSFVDNDFINNFIVVHKNDIDNKLNEGTIAASTDDNEYYLVRYY